jgi:hypothetical protein
LVSIHVRGQHHAQPVRSLARAGEQNISKGVDFHIPEWPHLFEHNRPHFALVPRDAASVAQAFQELDLGRAQAGRARVVQQSPVTLRWLFHKTAFP